MALGLSQSEFGEMLGVTARTVLRWEQGYTEIGEEHLQHIVDRTGSPVSVTVAVRRRVGVCAIEGCGRPRAVGRRKYCSARCAKKRR